MTMAAPMPAASLLKAIHAVADQEAEPTAYLLSLAAAIVASVALSDRIDVYLLSRGVADAARQAIEARAAVAT